MKTVLLAVIAAACAFAQGNSVNQTSGPPNTSWVTLYFRDGSGNTQYICSSPALTRTTTYAIGSTPALISIVVASNVGTINFGATAQLWVGQQVTVAASGTPALNLSYRLNTVSGTTATIATSGVPDGTYNVGTTTVWTTGPRLDALVWSIQVFTYTGTAINASYFASSGYTQPAGSGSVSVPNQLTCSSRANY